MTKTNHFRKFVALMAVAAAVLVTVPLIHSPASAQSKGITFTVNSTGDAADANTADDECDTDPVTANKQCTLRAAIEQANATPGANTIAFNIPESVDPGVKTISPTSQLPEITDPVTIDGYTQNGASKNTQEVGTNAVLKIKLSGAGAGDITSGLIINAPNTVVKGLVINRWDNRNIAIRSAGSGAVIESNFLGTDPTGTLDRGSRLAGVQVVADGVTIGGTTSEVRNLISGNGSGIDLGTSDNNKVEGNLIGTDKNGTSPLGNGDDGVHIGGENNTVGGTDPGARNTIAFNPGHGVNVVGIGTGNRILSNSILSNGKLGINLSGGTENTFSVTANDKKDPDTGANNLQNFPVITSATSSSTGTTTIKGKLNSRPRKTFTIQFFSTPPPESPEGKKFIGQKTVKTSRRGNVSFTFVATPAVNSGDAITATATNNSTGDTSEFSAPVEAQ